MNESASYFKLTYLFSTRTPDAFLKLFEARVVAQRVEHRLDVEVCEEAGALFHRAAQVFECRVVLAEAEVRDGEVVGRDAARDCVPFEFAEERARFVAA